MFFRARTCETHMTACDETVYTQRRSIARTRRATAKQCDSNSVSVTHSGLCQDSAAEKHSKWKSAEVRTNLTCDGCRRRSVRLAVCRGRYSESDQSCDSGVASPQSEQMIDKTAERLHPVPTASSKSADEVAGTISHKTQID